MTEKVAAAMTMQIVNNYFGATNQFSGFDVISPPAWVTDPGCYNQSGSIANVLRNNTIAGMSVGMTAMISDVIASFPPHCDGMNPEYEAAFDTLCDFFDSQYAYCEQLVQADEAS